MPTLTRHELVAFTEHLIDALDAMDPDADLEEDDPAGQTDKDGVDTGQHRPRQFWMHGNSFEGPGCWIADGGLRTRQDDPIV